MRFPMAVREPREGLSCAVRWARIRQPVRRCWGAVSLGAAGGASGANAASRRGAAHGRPIGALAVAANRRHL